MVEGECVKIEVLKPQLLCPYGSFQNQQGACVITDSIVPERICPSGFVPYEKGCIRRTVVQPIPVCPPTYHASGETGAVLCTKPIGDTPLWQCDVGVVEEGGVCVERQFSPPTPTCPDGFALQDGGCVRWTRSAVTYRCPPGFDLQEGPGGPLCLLEQEVAGVLTCRPPYELRGGLCVHREVYRAPPVCALGLTFDAVTGFCRRVKLQRALPQCRDGWVYSPERQKCILEEEPIFICPPDTNHFLTKPAQRTLDKDGCAQVELEPPNFACKEGDTPLTMQEAAAAAAASAAVAAAAVGNGGKVKGHKHHKAKAALGKGLQLGAPLADAEGPPLDLKGPPEEGVVVLAPPPHEKVVAEAAPLIISEAEKKEGGPPVKHHKIIQGPPSESFKKTNEVHPLEKVEETSKGSPEPPVEGWKHRVWGPPLGGPQGSPVEGPLGTSLGPPTSRRLQAVKKWLSEPIKETGLAPLKGEEPFFEDKEPLVEGPVIKGALPGGPLKEAPPLMCESLTVSDEAVRLDCPPGASLSFSVFDGGLKAKPQKQKSKQLKKKVTEMEIGKEIGKQKERQACVERRKEPAVAICDIPEAEMQPDGFCLWRETAEAIPICPLPGSRLDPATSNCLLERFTPAVPLCRNGLRFDAFQQLCTGIETLPPGWTCPEGFLLQHSLPQDPKAVLGDKDGEGGKGKKKQKKPATTVWGEAQCEQVELAAVQIVCPVGYALGRSKMGKAEACVAEKQIQGTFTCEAGFFLVGADCVKHIRAEPTAVDAQGFAFPCVLRGSGASCGHKGPWITEIDEGAVGDASAFPFEEPKK